MTHAACTTELAGSDCHAWIPCQGWYGPRSRSAWERARARRQNLGLVITSPAPMAATIALEMVVSMPGTLINRSQPVWRAMVLISFDKPSTRSSSRRQSQARSSTMRTMRGDRTPGGMPGCAAVHRARNRRRARERGPKRGPISRSRRTDEISGQAVQRRSEHWREMEMVRRNRRAYQVRDCAEPSRRLQAAEAEIDRALAPNPTSSATRKFLKKKP